MVPRHDPPSPRSTPARFGRFRVEHEIGAGALGPVLQARESHRDRLVAIKAITLEMTAEQADDVGDRLAALARAGLVHPSLVRPITAGVEAGTPYLVQEFVFGESLDVALRRYGPAPAADAARLVAQLAAALSTGAAANVLHGALHPRDVLVTPDLARVTGVGVRGVLQQAGVHLPPRHPYSPPECDTGVTWDARADVFSLAAIAWELVTGRPFAARLGDTLPGIDRVLAARPDEFERALSRALSVSPDDRQATARELAIEIEAALTGRVVHTTREVAPVAVAVPAGAATAPAEAPSARSGQPITSTPEEDRPAADEAVAESPVEPVPTTELASTVEPVPTTELASTVELAPTAEPASTAGFAPAETIGAGEVADASLQPAPGPDVVEPVVADAGDLRIGVGPTITERGLAVEREPAPADLPFDETLLEPAPDVAVVEPGVLEPEPMAAAGPAFLEVAPKVPELLEEPPELGEPTAGGVPRIEAHLGDAAGDVLRAPGRGTAPIMVTMAEPGPPRRRAWTIAIVSAAVLGVGVLGGYFAVGRRTASAPTAPESPPRVAAAREAPPPPTAPASAQPTSQPSAGPPAALATPRPAPDAASAPRAATPVPAKEGIAVPPRGAAPATAEIVVRSVPDGAGIFIDGALRGYTPRRLRDMPLGRHAIRVTRRGFVPGEASVTLTSAKPAEEVRFDLVPRPVADGSGRPAQSPGGAAAAPAAAAPLLVVRSQPAGARVFLDDKAVGVTPLTLSAVSSGLHVVRVEREGYRRWSIAVRVAPGKPARVEAPLQREQNR